jgi:putative nucleotidyltransferase with HDIG domain
MVTQQNSQTADRSRLLVAVPPFRPVAMRLMRLVGDSTQSLAPIVSLLRSDAVLTAEVLHLANSPMFACRAEIKNILQALSLLGLERINALIVTTALKSLVDKKHSVFTQSCWRHNLATALLCRRLAAPAGLPREECYVAGLLHDIGRMAMLRAYPEYERTLLLAASKGEDLMAVERESIGFDHCDAGSWLLSQRQFSAELQMVAAKHEDAPTPENPPNCLACLVGTSSKLADSIGLSVFASPSHPGVPEIAETCSERVRYHILSEFQDIVEWVMTRVNGIEQDLS